MRYFICLLIVWGACSSVTGQKEYLVACIAFYNLESLFDTLDSPDTDDFEFTPSGPNVYNSKVYWDKQQHLAKVIGEIGTEYTPDGPAILGVSEVENIRVLEDLVRQSAIAKRGYQIIHQDSRDGRGVDVPLWYQPKYFTPEQVFYFPLMSSVADEETKYSRDILFAAGKMNGEPIIVSINHWPSRRGREQTRAHLRIAAAAYNRYFLDSMATHHQITKSVVMGILNDDPVNESVRKYLRSEKSVEGLYPNDMYNPFEAFYRKGLGTTAYKDAWSLFDQIILSSDLAISSTGFRYHKAVVFNPPYLTQKSGDFKGYPLRAYAHGIYAGGYSDHFPVYVLLVKEKT
ncbi:MAG: endonuclease/exonuclease/phosphatase family protein [Saprospiraceae bacterium]|nr:endonuclease/exonuclease/phosphatase family protein [Saprospiraceae bacterium]